ncbi:hypothetical protein QJS10_CPB19g02000 [Acorus calamus]|uniref:Uncharacterized protein n=1 Tax=Acorus calamus TaxID=4465 RepID=A0AAV9CJE0_ACOCL|nr:hypothetical protein QJS10_CPB19g02000 [Acorus calamus]
MKKIPIFPKEDNVDCSGVEYDARMDFSKFLEDAQKHATEARNRPQKQQWDEATKVTKTKEKSNRKSWKNSLFFWPRHSKKSLNSANDSSMLNQRSIISGPLFGTTGRSDPRRWMTRPILGPLVVGGLKRDVEELEVPYMCLEELDNPNKVHSFGPIYLVT